MGGGPIPDGVQLKHESKICCEFFGVRVSSLNADGFTGCTNLRAKMPMACSANMIWAKTDAYTNPLSGKNQATGAGLHIIAQNSKC